MLSIWNHTWNQSISSPFDQAVLMCSFASQAAMDFLELTSIIITLIIFRIIKFFRLDIFQMLNLYSRKYSLAFNLFEYISTAQKKALLKEH